jgi:predicted  nucleic acid-binding Zn-ribbon protein
LTDEFRNLQNSRESDATSTTSKVVELQNQLQREREQGSAASREFAQAKGELDKLRTELVAIQSQQAHNATNAAEVAELKSALSQERERSTAAARELTAAQDEMKAVQNSRERDASSTSAKVEDLQGALQQESERSATADRDLKAAQHELQILRTAHQSDATSMTSKVSELQGALQQERGRSDSVAHELAAARDELSALQGLLKRETAEVAVLTEQKTAELKQLKDALARERSRADAVSRELADAIDEVRSARNVHGAGSTPLLFRLDATGAPSPIAVRYATEILQVSADSLPVSYSNETAQVEDTGSTPVRVSSLGDAPLPIRGQGPSLNPPAPDQRAAISPVPEAGKMEGASAQAASEDRLVARADTLLRAGDVSGARLLLERSMESGNARAAFLLAETFDPHFLSKLGALGIRSDAAKARELYARARALGITQADERMQALK